MPARIALSLVLLAGLAGAPLHAADGPARPSLAVTTLDGARFDLAAEHGRWVIVNFWATWCTPCIKEMPELSAYVEEHPQVRAIGIAWEDTERDEVLAFAKAHPVAYPLAQMDVYAAPGGFETPRGLPTTYLIAPDGSIAKKFVGPITAADLDRVIAPGAKPAGP